MSAMIDTHILSYALFGITGSAANIPKNRAMVEASRVLLRRMDRICISAVTWTELHRIVKPARHQVLTIWAKRLKILPLTAPIALRAAEILNQRNRPDRVCSRCLNATQTHPCTSCQAKIPNHQRVADGMIVATADLTTEVTTLFCYDTGVLALAPYIQNCAIREPDHADGPLFQRAVDALSPPSAPPI